MEALSDKPTKRKTIKIRRRTGTLRKKGKPVPICELVADTIKPTEFMLPESQKRGRLLRLSPMGATVEYDPSEYIITYYGAKEVKKVARETVVISSQTIVQELR